MVVVHTAILRHKGLLVDNTTKIELLLPELTESEDAELVKHAKFSSAAVIIMDPDMLESYMDILSQVKGIHDNAPAEEPEEPSSEGWEEDEETGFSSR